MSIELLEPTVKRRSVAYPALQPGTPEWTEKRKTLIGASEVPALFGEIGGDGYKSPFQIWLDKTGKSEEEPRAPDSPAAIGSAIERSLGGVYQRTLGIPVIRQAWTEHDETLPILAATPDFDCFESETAEDRSHAVQVKNRGGFPQGWGAPGTDQVPRAVLIQVLSEITVTQLPFIRVAALLSGNRFQVYHIERDDDMSDVIRNVVGEFWTKHILGDEPPPATGPGVHEYAAKLFPSAKDKTVRLLQGAEADPVFAALYTKKLADEAVAKFEDEKAQMKLLIGDSYGVETLTGDKVLWANQGGRSTISEESLRASLREHGLTLDQGTIENIVLAATKKGADFRTLRFYPAK